MILKTREIHHNWKEDKTGNIAIVKMRDSSKQAREIILTRWNRPNKKLAQNPISGFWGLFSADSVYFTSKSEICGFLPTLKFEQSAADRAIELFSRKFAQEDRSLRSAIWCEWYQSRKIFRSEKSRSRLKILLRSEKLAIFLWIKNSRVSSLFIYQKSG